MSAFPRLFRAFFLVLFASALATGCGTTSQENESLASRPLKGAQARLKIIRTSDLVASVPSARVRVDGREVAQLGVGGSIVLDVPAGSRKIVVDAFGHPNVYSITLKAKPGMLYTMEVSPRAEAAVAGVMFGFIGMMVEAAANENGGTFQIRIVDAKPARG